MSTVLDGVAIIFIPTPVLFCAALAVFLLSALFWVLFALWWRRAKSRLHRPALPPQEPYILPFGGRHHTTYFAPKRKLATSRKE